MSWCTELPAELTCKPLGLVTLAGLDVTNSPVHKTIWESFAVGRQPQRVPIAFQCVEFSHPYPKARAKRTSYDWYVPKGIVKTNWMRKHLTEIPAVTVVFYDLDWDDPQWTERCGDLASKVDQVRSSLQGRSTKIGLVLVQKNAGLPGDQDLDQQQKAHTLCGRCGNIPAKSLFVLPYTEHLPGYVMRLENAFYDMAQNYYYSEARRVKSYRELLNKTTHQLLFVRHQFKAAFFNELKQDPTSALRHYKQAYEHIKELRMYDSHMLEIKVVAGFVSYKICRIAFQQSTPRDAIGQFRQHVDLFKNKVGIRDLAFEHSAWMAKQFSVFGDLFSEAIGVGLTALITQHPGFYFQQAANHSIQRRKQCRSLCSSAAVAEATSTSDPLEALDKLDYFGQRPWRQGHQSIDPPEPAREREGILALQRRELEVQHCTIIIPLLSSAVSQFKRYKSTRMKRYLIVLMGEEYYQAREHAKALELVSHVMWEYRAERWLPLLHAVLGVSLRSAFLVGNVAAFVAASMELMSDHFPEQLVSLEEKSKIQSNLMRVLFLTPGNGCPEDADLFSSGDSSPEDVATKWRLSDGDEDSPFSPASFTVDMSSLASFVRVKARFTSPAFDAASLVVIEVAVIVSSPAPIRFSRLRLLFSDSYYDAFCHLDDGDALLCEPGLVHAYRFRFLPKATDVGSVLRIVAVSLTLGDASRRCAELTWSEGGGDVLSDAGVASMPTIAGSADASGPAPILWSQPPPRSRKLEPDIEWCFISRTPTTTKIETRAPKVELEVDHSPPCLVNEFYVLELIVKNLEDSPVSELRIDVGLKDPSSGDTVSTHISADSPTLEGDPIARVSDVSLPDLDAGASLRRRLYLKTLQPGERRFRLTLEYSVTVSPISPQLTPTPLHPASNIVPIESSVSTVDAATKVVCRCRAAIELVVPSMRPFQIVTKPLTMRFEPTEVVFSDEPFLLCSDIKSISEWPVQIKTSHLEISDALSLPPGESKLTSMLEDLTLMPHDVCRDLYCLVPVAAAESSLLLQQQQRGLGVGATIALGKFTIEWRRTSGENCDEKNDLPFVKSSMSLPQVTRQTLPLGVELKLPPYGTMRSPMDIRFKIENKTMLPQDLEIVMESSEGFMFSGHKQMTLRLLPFDNQEFVYNLFPLVAGNVTLPRLHINATRFPGSNISDIFQSLLPTQIFILPAGKGMIEGDDDAGDIVAVGAT